MDGGRDGVSLRGVFLAVAGRAGAGAFDHPDGILLLEPVRWAREILPHWLIVENVDGIPDNAIAMVVRELEAIFPAISILRLNAEAFVAQRRGHVFVVAGPRHIPVPTPPPGPPRFRDIADGSGAVLVDVPHLRYALGKQAFQIPVVGPNDPLPTVTTRPFHGRWTCFVVERPGLVRFPTFREAARAQGFPDDHPLHTLVQERPAMAWRLLGNAVPVPLARAVVRAVMEVE